MLTPMDTCIPKSNAQLGQSLGTVLELFFRSQTTNTRLQVLVRQRGGVSYAQVGTDAALFRIRCEGKSITIAQLSSD
jgi:hypothetical protein